MSESRHIFLSYRSSEVEFALRLAADLKNAGVNLWMDRLDIRPGDDWRKSLESAVYNSTAVISILSPGYVTSKYCQRELARADRLGRPIFPVLLGTIAETDWPLEIEREQYIDFSHWHNNIVLYQQKVNTLVDILKERFAGQISVIPDPETQYLTNLIAELESRHGLSSYLETSTAADKWLNRELIRPEPRNVRMWHRPKMFRLRHLPIDGDAGSILQAPFARREVVKDIYDVLADHKQIVLTGVPDSGKTTMLRHLVMDSIYAYQGMPDASIPLLLDLVGWDDQRSWEEFVRASWPLSTDPIKLLQQGKLALYLDGLNELSGAKSRKAKELRTWLAANKETAQVIVTCRDSAYHGDLDLGVPIIELRTLDRDNVESFIHNYLGDDLAPILLAQLLPQNYWEEDHKQYLYGLTKNPVLLSALIVVFKSSSFGYIPQNLGSLLKQVLHDVWERETQDETHIRCSFEEIESALADLAFTMVQDDMEVHIPVEYALEIIGDERQLLAAVNLNLICLKYGNVRFAYDILKDYFAALAILKHGVMHMITPPQIGHGGEYLPTKWDRPVIILSGLLPEHQVNLFEIAKHNPFLALECIANGLNVSPDQVDPVIGQLIQFANTAECDARVATATILAKINSDLALTILLEAMRDGHWDVRCAAMMSFKDIDVLVLEGLTEVLENLDYTTQESAYAAIRYLGESALPTLLKLLQHEKWKTRRSAAWALGYVKDQAAVPALVQALYDEDNLVSAEAANALAIIRDSAAIPWLINVLNHQNWRVRKAAAKGLADIGPAAVPYLLKVLEHDATNIRRLAIEVLAETHDTQVTEALLNASFDESVDVRGAAIKALDGREDQVVVKRLIECLSDTAKTKWNRNRICDIAARILTNLDTSQNLGTFDQLSDSVISSSRLSNNGEAMTSIPKGSAATAKDRLMRQKSGEPESQSSEVSMTEDLSHADWQIRLQAIEKMSSTGASPVSTFLLIQAIDDVEIQVRIAAMKAIPVENVGACVNAWQKGLKDADAAFVEASIQHILGQGAKAVLPLIELLYINNSIVKAHSARLLGTLGDERAVSGLIDCLTDGGVPGNARERVCDIAAKSLRQIGTPRAIKSVDEWRAEPVASREATATVALQSKDEHRLILTEILTRLRQSDWGDKEEAAKALREYAKTMHGMGDPTTVKQLEAALADPEWIVRWAAAEALAWIGDQSAVGNLVEILNDPVWTVRIAVVRALLEIGDADASQHILHLLHDRNCMVREAAAEALGYLANPTTIAGLTASLSDDETLVRLAVVVALGKINHPAVIEPLTTALKDDDGNVRWAAAAALRHINTESIVPRLIDQLDDVEGPYWEDERVCDLVAEALINIGTPDAKAAVEVWRSKSLLSNE